MNLQQTITNLKPRIHENIKSGKIPVDMGLNDLQFLEDFVASPSYEGFAKLLVICYDNDVEVVK